MKLWLGILFVYSFSLSAFAQDVYRVTSDTTLGGVFDNCNFTTGECTSTPEMMSGHPRFVTLRQGQLVWISDINSSGPIKGDVALVHFIANKERSLLRYGTMNISLLQKVENCSVSDVLAKGRCP